MQKCLKCGKEIKYIAAIDNSVIACDAEQIVVYSEYGRKILGYTVHKCETELKMHEGENFRQNCL